MKSSAIKATIEQGAAEIKRLHARVHETFRFRDSSSQQRDAWLRACSEFHSRYSSLAFPGGYEGVIERIKAGDSFSIEAALCFLELRPYFFRSGYMFSEILRKLKRAELSVDQASRLKAIVQRQALWRAKRRDENAT
jgi:hypothetical protein